jgi:hypothetical protein
MLFEHVVEGDKSVSVYVISSEHLCTFACKQAQIIEQLPQEELKTN